MNLASGDREVDRQAISIHRQINLARVARSALPDRINTTLLDWLSKTRLQKVVVLHINHPDEVDTAVIAACSRLKEANVTLLNQSVLLRGINDSVAVLADLSELEANVLPYLPARARSGARGGALQCPRWRSPLSDK